MTKRVSHSSAIKEKSSKFILVLLKSPQIRTFLKLLFLILTLSLIKLGSQPLYIFSKILIPGLSKISKVVYQKSGEILNNLKNFHPSIPSLKLKVPVPRGLKPVRLIIAFILILVLLHSVLLIELASDLPSPYYLTTNPRPLTTQIYDVNGKLLYQFYEGRNRKLVKLEDLPPQLINATIAIEDKNFFSHPGVDILGIARAVKINLSGDKNNLQGGSTITQQLIKNTLLSTDKTFKRKFKEAILALWAESIYSKEEILQMYMNEVPYGGPAWGTEAASEMYFGVSSKDLDLAQNSYLAGLPASPTEFSPYGTNPEKGKQRQFEVLRRMVEEGYISQNEADEAYQEKLDFKPPTTDIKAPHFVMYVRSLLASKYGQRTVSQGGLSVTTTLDLDTQQIAETVVSEEVNKLSALGVGNGAAMVVDSSNGHILAMVGSKDYWDPKQGNFNVTVANRQPGSSIKPITYVSAFKQGFSPGNILLDAPTVFQSPGGKPYKPVNYDGKFHGPVSIRTALGSSYNIPAVKMLAIIGLPSMIQTAHDLGITTFVNPQDYGLSLTLGGGEVKMIDMMAVYNSLSSGGLKYEPTAILKVSDSYGNTLEDNSQVLGKRVITEEIAYLINHILSDNRARTPAFGPNSQLLIPGHTVAAKTGTTDNKRDNWTFGYTKEFVVGAWVGNNDNTPMDPRLTSGVTGAAPIWNKIMTALTLNRPNLAFVKPSGIIETRIDGNRDLAISGSVPKSVVLSKKLDEKDGKRQGGKDQDKEIVTYTDPFILNYIPDQTNKNPLLNGF